MGCAILAARSLPTLILAHRKPLLDQWRAQLTSTLDLDAKQLGQLGGGRNQPTGVVDLAMIQSLTRLPPPTWWHCSGATAWSWSTSATTSPRSRSSPACTTRLSATSWG